MLVRLARTAVRTYLERSVIMDAPKPIETLAGVFVTLNYVTQQKQEHLRGCIGFPLPHKPLTETVVEAAIAAATQDPRFPPVRMNDFKSISFEVSVLTTPEELDKTRQYRDQVVIGRHGLILRWKYGSGLLLPQVPVELNWDVDEYLVNLCQKAGAPLDALDEPTSKLYSFQASVFKEVSPEGHVLRVTF